MKRILVLVLLAAGALASGAALAHGGRVHFGIGIGVGPYWGPFWGPAYYPAPLYYPAPVYYGAPAAIAAPPAPAQYVERPDQPYQSGYWYYCETSRGYYPYVKSCPTGWKAVPPAPPPAQ